MYDYCTMCLIDHADTRQITLRIPNVRSYLKIDDLQSACNYRFTYDSLLFSILTIESRKLLKKKKLLNICRLIYEKYNTHHELVVTTYT